MWSSLCKPPLCALTATTGSALECCLRSVAGIVRTATGQKLLDGEYLHLPNEFSRLREPIDSNLLENHRLSILSLLIASTDLDFV